MFDKIKLFFIILKISRKISKMTKEERDLYLIMFRTELDLEYRMSAKTKEALHRWIDNLEKTLNERSKDADRSNS